MKEKNSIKIIIALICSIMVVLSLTLVIVFKDKRVNKGNAEASSIDNPIESNDVFLEAQEEDFITLYGTEEDNKNCLIATVFDVCESFDCSSASANDFLDNVFFYAAQMPESEIYEYYFGKPKHNKEPDPLNKFLPSPPDGDDPEGEDYFEKYESDKVDWIMKTIFGIEPTHEGGFNYDERNYYYDGFYYASMAWGIGNEGGYQFKFNDKRRLEDGRYEINLKRYVYDFDTIDYEYELIERFIVGLKLIEGKKQWCIYSIELIKSSDNGTASNDTATYAGVLGTAVRASSIETQIENHYKKVWPSDGDYICTQWKIENGYYSCILRFQMSEEAAEEKIKNGGTVFPNTYVSTIKIDMSTGLVTDENNYAPSWRPDYPCASDELGITFDF